MVGPAVADDQLDVVGDADRRHEEAAELRHHLHRRLVEGVTVFDAAPALAGRTPRRGAPTRSGRRRGVRASRAVVITAAELVDAQLAAVDGLVGAEQPAGEADLDPVDAALAEVADGAAHRIGAVADEVRADV